MYDDWRFTLSVVSVWHFLSRFYALAGLVVLALGSGVLAVAPGASPAGGD